MAAAATTLYAGLVGVGSWLLGAPARFGLPRAAWIGGLVLLAAGCVPGWLPGLLRDEDPPAAGPHEPRSQPSMTAFSAARALRTWLGMLTGVVRIPGR